MAVRVAQLRQGNCSVFCFFFQGLVDEYPTPGRLRTTRPYNPQDRSFLTQLICFISLLGPYSLRQKKPITIGHSVKPRPNSLFHCLIN
jgi:hypothetical protein